MINQGKVIGILYLENNLTPHVFTSDRVATLKVLAAQAAISLENARLYRDLAEREAKIRRLVDANIIGIYLWDLQGRSVEANDAFLRILGYDREDLASGNIIWTDLTPKEWLKADAALVRQLKKTGGLQAFEKEYFRKDGSRVPLLMGAASFDGGANQGVAFVLDLTERKHAEQALRDSKEALRRNEAYLAEAQQLGNSGSVVVARQFGSLLREIVETIDSYGLKARYLRKHKKVAFGFVERVISMKCVTEVGAALQKRIEKNSDRLFTFLDYDGVPWNNNNAGLIGHVGLAANRAETFSVGNAITDLVAEFCGEQ